MAATTERERGNVEPEEAAAPPPPETTGRTRGRRFGLLAKQESARADSCRLIPAFDGAHP